jgi:acetyl-CoA carboxylase biotin carboxylase subunit
MIGKLLAHGATREQAIARMRTALMETIIEGVNVNIPLHQDLMEDTNFIQGGTSIHYLEQKLAKPTHN